MRPSQALRRANRIEHRSAAVSLAEVGRVSTLTGAVFFGAGDP